MVCVEIVLLERVEMGMVDMGMGMKAWGWLGYAGHCLGYECKLQAGMCSSHAGTRRVNRFCTVLTYSKGRTEQLKLSGTEYQFQVLDLFTSTPLLLASVFSAVPNLVSLGP